MKQGLIEKRDTVIAWGLLIGLVTLVFWGVNARLASEDNQYPHGEYNHHVCVEVYKLNEECK